MSSENFVRLIEKGLEKEKISLRELARRSSLDVSFLSKILSGKRNPPSKEKDIRKTAKALNMSPEKLIISCGRIPSNMETIFEDEDFVGSLLKGDIKGIKEKVKTEKLPAGSEGEFAGPGEIEDELL